MITNEKMYKDCLDKAIQLANQEYLVTFGIEPTVPETGFGYIEYSENDVLGFREKPDIETAQKFLDTGNFLWNSGMFCFKAGVFLKELKMHSKEVYESSMPAWKSIKNNLIGLEEMSAMPDISVDYAVFEKSDKIKTIPSSFGWTDLGTFDSLIYYYENYPDQIDVIQQIDGIDTNTSFCIGNKKVFGIGISDIIVVDTEDCLLVLPKIKSQAVKEIYSKIKISDIDLVE